jgi:Homeodomain-like domain
MRHPRRMGYDVVRMRVKSEDRRVMEGWLRAPTTPQALARRARIVLASAEGEAVRPMAKWLGVAVNTVNVWRRRYREQGLAGLRTRGVICDTYGILLHRRFKLGSRFEARLRSSSARIP